MAKKCKLYDHEKLVSQYTLQDIAHQDMVQLMWCLSVVDATLGENLIFSNRPLQLFFCTDYRCVLKLFYAYNLSTFWDRQIVNVNGEKTWPCVILMWMLKILCLHLNTKIPTQSYCSIKRIYYMYTTYLRTILLNVLEFNIDILNMANK